MKYIYLVEYHKIENQEHSFSRYFSSEKKAKEEVEKISRLYGITPKFEKTSLKYTSFLYVTDQYGNAFYKNKEYKEDSSVYPAIITKREINKNI